MAVFEAIFPILFDSQTIHTRTRQWEYPFAWFPFAFSVSFYWQLSPPGNSDSVCSQCIPPASSTSIFGILDYLLGGHSFAGRVRFRAAWWLTGVACGESICEAVLSEQVVSASVFDQYVRPGNQFVINSSFFTQEV